MTWLFLTREEAVPSCCQQRCGSSAGLGCSGSRAREQAVQISKGLSQCTNLSADPRAGTNLQQPELWVHPHPDRTSDRWTLC